MTDFGPMIRATRLGWGYSRQHGCFVRMSDVPPNEFRIELCPPNGVPGIKTPGRSHRVWWEGGQDILAMLPWLKQVRSIKRYVCVIVDMDGAIVRTAPPHTSQ